MTTIIVYNLHPITTVYVLDLVYSRFGNIEDIKLAYNYAMITFENYNDAMNAIEATDGSWLDSRKLLVTLGN